MESKGLSIEPMFTLGPLEITNTVVTTWAIMAFLSIAAALFSYRLEAMPKRLQTAVESVVIAMEEAVAAVAFQYTEAIMPLIATFWVFLVTANLSGVIPGIHAPTRDFSCTAALAVIVFFSSHWFGIKTQGVRNYLNHYIKPTPLLLPFHLVSEVTRSVALAIRLFGNMMSLEMAALLILFVAGFLAPVPILMLHIVEALVQAYIFGMLALIYLSAGIQQRTKS